MNEHKESNTKLTTQRTDKKQWENFVCKKSQFFLCFMLKILSDIYQFPFDEVITEVIIRVSSHFV